MIDIARALQIGWPQGKWNLIGNDYSGLTWFGPGDAPTMEELQEAWDNRPSEPLPNAENYQIRAWMIRNDLDPDAVPQMISQLVTDAKEQKEALMRWDYAVRVPRNFPLVNAIGAQMGLTPEQIDAAWPDIINL
jgi:hypothetical protein